MKRVLRLALPIVVFSMLVTTGAVAQEAMTATGEVKARDAESLTIHGEDGEDHTFTVDADTQITERGYTLSVEELGYGDMVDVTYETVDGGMHATSVTVTIRYQARYR